MILNNNKIIIIIITIIILTIFNLVIDTSLADSKSMNNHKSLYHSYFEITSEYRLIDSEHPKITKLHNIDTTYENRTIWAIKISDNPQLEEPDILIIGCHHPRELISVEIPLYFANYLVDNYKINADITNIIGNREIWIIPMLNPDGHVYVEQGHTNWRKNRCPIDEYKDGKIDAYGVDLN